MALKFNSTAWSRVKIFCMIIQPGGGVHIIVPLLTKKQKTNVSVGAGGEGLEVGPWGVYLLLLHFQRKTSLGITNCNSLHVIHAISTAISTFSPFGSLYSNGIIMCVCVCVFVCVCVCMRARARAH